MALDDDTYNFPFEDIDDIENNVTKRQSCERCSRPESVCVCYSFPAERLDIKTQLHILQHPREQDFRLLTTVPLLQECLPKDKCRIYRGRRFPVSKYKHLHDLCDFGEAVLLYPSDEAVTLEEYVSSIPASSAVHLIVLDGTWREAKGIYYNCKFLHHLKKVKLSGSWKSEFVIKTQPNNASVSTLEAIAIALSQIENNPSIIEVARKPLKALCDFQLQHGATFHHSKEDLAALGIKYKGAAIRKKWLPKT